jgi:heme exporter protein CcmD
MAPQFKSFAEFANMGGNAAFVFGAWGLSIAVIAILIGRAIINGKNQKARLAALEQERQAP